MAFLIFTGWLVPAAACPNCPVGREARSQAWNADFAFNLFVTLLPFLVIGGACLAIEASDRRVRKGKSESQALEAAITPTISPRRTEEP